MSEPSRPGRIRKLAIAGLIAVAVYSVTPVVKTLAPEPGLDPSHKAAMHMAVANRLQYGDEIVFTFGPAGFTVSPKLYYSKTAVLAYLAFAAVQLAALLLVALLLLLGRLGVIATLGATYIIGAIAISGLLRNGLPELTFAVIAISAVAFLVQRRPRFALAGIAGLAGLAGIVFVTKFSPGLSSTAVIAVAVICRSITSERRLRTFIVEAGVGASSFVISVIALFTLLHQSISNLPSYLRESVSFASGFSDAMSYEDPLRKWEYGAALIALAMIGWTAWAVSRRMRTANRVALFTILGLLLAAAFLEGFERHDAHSFFFFAMPLVALPVLWLRSRRGLVVGTGAVLVVSLMAAGNIPPSRLLEVGSGLKTNARIAGTLASSSKRASVMNESREELQRKYDLSDETRARIAGRTVHIDPWEASVAWAYPEVTWRPAPIFQDYAAYNANLDDINARFLESDRAPEIVLHQNLAIDYRFPRFESPNYVLALYCNYRQIATDKEWALLERSPGRCDRTKEVSSTAAAFGETVPVPQSPLTDTFIVATFTEIDPPLRDAVGSAIFKGDPYVFTANSPAGQRVGRFLPGHAANYHLLSAPDCLVQSLDPRLFDISPFGDISIRVGSETSEARGKYRVTFYSLGYRC